jgi:hypothetical protein
MTDDDLNAAILACLGRSESDGQLADGGRQVLTFALVMRGASLSERPLDGA